MRSLLITGGTGTLGRALAAEVLRRGDYSRICIYSRDEAKQAEMRDALLDPDKRLRFFIGDVRDLARLRSALHGVHDVVHTAALKRIETCAYNPFEAVQTNVVGSQNVVMASLEAGVERALLVSTDKAVEPVNLYGATKLTAERIFLAGSVYGGATALAVVRYGNVLGSRGSVVQRWQQQAARGEPITVTNKTATRFWITLPQAVSFVLLSLERMADGDVFVPALPACSVGSLVEAFGVGARGVETGLGPEEKLHETLIASGASAGRVGDARHGDFYMLGARKHGAPFVGPLSSNHVALVLPEVLRQAFAEQA